MSNNTSFDFERFKEQAHQQLQQGASLLGADGVLTPLIKQFLEQSLEAELDAHLEHKPTPNRRNGKGSKRVRTSVGPVEIATPRDRDSSFAPKILPKRKRQLSADLDRQIIALYARGSSYSDIRDYLGAVRPGGFNGYHQPRHGQDLAASATVACPTVGDGLSVSVA